MSVKRLLLDSGVLDQDRIIGTGTIVLDNRAVLDSNIIAGTDYSGSVSYNDNQTFYNGSKLIYDYAASELGGLTSSAQTTPQVIISAESNLGAITSLASASVAHFVEGSTNLGGLVGQANTTPTILPIFDATLGALSAAASAVAQIQATASATLGSLSASSQATPEIEIIATAALGSLIATAQASTPTPPQPANYGSNGYVPIRKKQKKERPTPVIVPEIVDIPELPPLIKSVFASASADNISELYASAENRIDFSILRDEQELMMLL